MPPDPKLAIVAKNEPMPITTQTIPTANKICPNCGVENDDGAKYCNSCGKPLY